MGANIKHIKLHQTYREDETGRLSCNFVKGREFGSLYFNSADYSIYMCGGFVPEHVHSDIEEVFYIVRGSGVAILDGKKIPVRAGDVVPIPAGVRHGMQNDGSDTLENIVCSVRLGGTEQ